MDSGNTAALFTAFCVATVGLCMTTTRAIEREDLWASRHGSVLPPATVRRCVFTTPCLSATELPEGGLGGIAKNGVLITRYLQARASLGCGFGV